MGLLVSRRIMFLGTIQFLLRENQKLVSFHRCVYHIRGNVRTQYYTVCVPRGERESRAERPKSDWLAFIWHISARTHSSAATFTVSHFAPMWLLLFGISVCTWHIPHARTTLSSHFCVCIIQINLRYFSRRSWRALCDHITPSMCRRFGRQRLLWVARKLWNSRWSVAINGIPRLRNWRSPLIHSVAIITFFFFAFRWASGSRHAFVTTVQ